MKRQLYVNYIACEAFGVSVSDWWLVGNWHTYLGMHHLHTYMG